MRALFVFLLPFLAFSQPWPSFPPSLPSMRAGEVLPSVCFPQFGDTFFKTKAPAAGMYYCSSADHWARLAPAPDLEDTSGNVTVPGTLTVTGAATFSSASVGSQLGTVTPIDEATSVTPKLTSAHQATVLFDQSTSTGANTVIATAYVAFPITPGAVTMYAGAVRLKSSATLTNPSGALTLYVYSDTSGSPGTLLASGSTTAYYGGLTTSYQEFQFALNYGFTAATQYWIVLRRSDSPVGGTISIDGAASGTAQYATSSDAATWTPVNNVTPWCKLYDTTTISGYGYSQNLHGLEGVSVNSRGVQGSSVNSVGAYGKSTHGAGVSGYSQNWLGVLGNSLNSIGVWGQSQGSYAGYFSQQGTLQYNNAFPVLAAIRQYSSLSGKTATGAVIRGEDTTASTGNMMELVKQGATVMSVSGAGITTIGGGSASKAVCWKSDGKTLGYCSDVVAADGSCTCN